MNIPRLAQLTQLRTITWDGDLISKHDRDELQRAGLVERAYGYNFLTTEGVRFLLVLNVISPGRKEGGE